MMVSDMEIYVLSKSYQKKVKKQLYISHIRNNKLCYFFQMHSTFSFFYCLQSMLRAPETGYLLIYQQQQKKLILMEPNKEDNKNKEQQQRAQVPQERIQGPQQQPAQNLADQNEQQQSGQQEDWHSIGDEESQEQEQEVEQSKPQQIEQQYTLGCEHYLRNCQVQAPCCKKYYVCKLCHDDKYEGPKSNGCKVQRMAFSDVANIKCLKCNKIQQPSLKCTNPECQISFGRYACLKCKLFQNRSSKVNDIFHCDQCKMCRRGKVESFFHCQKCGYCRPICQKNNHKCTQNLADSQCPICLDVLKYSTKHYIALPCGHLIHLKCLEGYRDINCPVCGMATQKFSEAQNKQMDMLIEQTRGNMPKQVLDKKVDILCNQCLHKSYQQPFHFMGIKCQGCGTYNTKMI